MARRWRSFGHKAAFGALGVFAACTSPSAQSTDTASTHPSPSASALAPAQDLQGTIAFVGAPEQTNGNQIFTFPAADPSDLHQVTHSSDAVVGPDLSANGTIAFGVLRGPNSNIAVIDTKRGGDPQPLTSSRGYEANPAWSPDGTKIAYISNRGGPYDVWVMNTDGSQPRALTNGDAIEESPAWSPDGTKIAFGTARDGNLEIYVMNADGSNVKRLTKNTEGVPDQFPAWSPDGSKIAFTRGNGGPNLDVWVMSATGGNQHVLAAFPGLDGGPAWSPDGSKIAFSSEQSGRIQIWVMNADGSDPYQLTHTDGFAFSPDWGS